MQSRAAKPAGAGSRVPAWLVALGLALMPAAVPAGAAGQAATEPPAGGLHDFDWEAGTWTTRVRRLARPLSGSHEWLEYTGTTVVRPLLDGRANVAELEVQGPAGRIEGVSLRLYEPQARRWSLHYAGARDGLLTPAVSGGFRGGRGLFLGRDTFAGRPVLVRFVITRDGADSARFEQAFSADGGKTWESNWIATDTRVAGR